MSALTVLAGDWREEHQKIADRSVHCCVTSPPYFGLRDYKVAGQIGLEKSLADYIEQIVVACSHVHRVLRDDGTFWLNLGDAYAGGGHGGGGSFARDRFHLADKNEQASWRAANGRLTPGFKHKELMGVPWRVAFALQAAGWYLRCDIIWHKPNPMPESVTDRPTKAHEYLFLLTKGPSYYYDAEAIRESATKRAPGNKSHKSADAVSARVANGDHRERTKLGLKHIHPSSSRNRRSVWTVAPASYRGAHFATFPPELIRPAILAGTSAHGCCAACGAPYERRVEKGEPNREQQRACGSDLSGGYTPSGRGKYFKPTRAQNARTVKQRILAGMTLRKTVGWKATCDCAAAVVPCTVLDPFGGAFTTGMVALEEGRQALMCELNPEYIEMGQSRCAGVAGRLV